MKYLVTYVLEQYPFEGDHTDHYEAFDTLEDAQERYEDLTNPAKFRDEFGDEDICHLWSANVSKVLRSTDYL